MSNTVPPDGYCFFHAVFMYAMKYQYYETKYTDVNKTFKLVVSKYRDPKVRSRKLIVGMQYISTMERLLRQFQKMSKNTVEYNSLKPHLLTRIEMVSGAMINDQEIIIRYKDLINRVRQMVRAGRNLCEDFYVDQLEIKSFAERYNLLVKIKVLSGSNTHWIYHRAKRPTAEINLVLKNKHYTLGGPPTQLPATASAGSGRKNNQQGNNNNNRQSTRGGTENAGGGNKNNNNTRNNGNSKTKRRKAAAGENNNNRTYDKQPSSRNTSRASNNQQNQNSNQNNEGPDAGNFNPRGRENRIFNALHSTNQVPAAILGAARKHGLGSKAFEKVFRPYVKSLPHSMGCNREMPQLSRGQIDVYQRAKIMAELSLEMDHNARGLLVHANTGSGKTVMCMAIFLAYWSTGRTLYVITTKDNIDNNNPDEYMNIIQRFFPEHYKLLLNKYGSNKEIKEKLFLKVRESKIQKMKKINFITLEVFAHKLGYGRGTKDNIFRRQEEALVVFDESHNLFNSLQGRVDADSPKYILKRLMSMTPEERRNIHVYLLSATPTACSKGDGKEFDNWFKVFSVVAPPLKRYFENGMSPYTVMKSMFRGSNNKNTFIEQYVAPLMVYIDQRFDLTQHACVKDVRTFVKCTKWFYGALVHTMYDDTVDEAYLRRMAGAMGVEVDKIRVLKQAKEVMEIFQEKKMILPIKKVTKTYKWLLSPKAVAIAKFVTSHKGKHFLYIKDRSQATVLQHILTRFYGYHRIDLQNHNNNNNGNKYYGGSGKRGKPGVIMLDSGTQHEFAKKIFDHVNNDDGSRCRCIIASGGMYEGVNFQTIRYVHVCTPLNSALEEQQLSGRGVRHCSHERLPKKERTVTVMRWFLEPPSERSMFQMVQYLRKKGTNDGVVKRLSSLLTKVEKKMGRHKDKGPGFFVRECYLGNPDALALWNFERAIQSYLKGRPASATRNRIVVVGGAQCK